MSAGKIYIVVYLGDGSATKIPQRWTAADGTTQCAELGGVLRTLRNPIYAGAYVFGKSETVRR